MTHLSHVLVEAINLKKEVEFESDVRKWFK